MPPKKKPNISLFLTLTPDLKKYTRSKLRGMKVKLSEDQLDLKNIDKKTEILGVFVDSLVDKKTINALKKLKLIVTFSTGFDHIDLKTAQKKRITVCNVPTYGENTVAEFAVALMLSLTRNMFPAVKRVKEGGYDYHGLRGCDIKGKTIGVIGTGHIGQRFIEMLQGFHANVIAFDAFPKKSLQKQLGFTYVSKTKLLKESDIISLHVPLLPGTHHMINKTAIKKMKKGVFVINTARGGLIDSEALLWGLEKNLVGGAGLDVLEGEDLLEDTLKILCKDCNESKTRLSLMNNMLIDHPNTIITPHNAFNSTEAVKRIIDTATQNIKSFTQGKPINTVQIKK